MVFFMKLNYATTKKIHSKINNEIFECQLQVKSLDDDQKLLVDIWNNCTESWFQILDSCVMNLPFSEVFMN